MTPKGHHQEKQFYRNLTNYSTTIPIFDLRVSLDGVRQDLNLLSFGGNHSRGLEPIEPKNQFFMTNFMIFKRNSIFVIHFIEYNNFIAEALLQKKSF